MSIGKRLIDLARAELNSLLDRAAREDEDDGGYRSRRRPTDSGDFAGMSDEDLAAEIERRRKAREEVEDAVRGGRRPPPPRSAPPRTAAGDGAIRNAYVTLEVPAGSDFETVRKSYRNLMRKYHPDLHGGTPEKHRAATDRTQKLTEAYKTLEKQLRRR
jgi:DnaJ-domain-containing protein 1